jgi:hypothetical protein
MKAGVASYRSILVAGTFTPTVTTIGGHVIVIIPDVGELLLSASEAQRLVEQLNDALHGLAGDPSST